jgi:YggT family protein
LTLNVLFALAGLALLLRLLLPWFRLSRDHPVMRFLQATTEPLVRPVRASLGNSVMWMGGRYVDVAPLVTFFVLWMGRYLLIRLLYLVAYPPLWLLQPGENLERWLIGVLNLFFQAYALILLVRILLGWLRVPYTHPVMRFVWNVTEPLLAPIRRRIPTFAGLDFTPVLLLLGLSVVQMLLAGLIRAVF